MSNRDTSRDVYKQITEEGLLSKRRKQVYDVLVNIGTPVTGDVIASKVKEIYGSWGHSESIRNRLTELRNLDVVDEAGTGISPLSGRRGILWVVSGRLPKNLNLNIQNEINKLTIKINKLAKQREKLKDLLEEKINLF